MPGRHKLNEQTGQCDRIPPPPVKCKEGFAYNPKTKQCEPPPRVETTCPKGFTKLKSGKCQRIVQQPDCPRNFVLNPKTGQCEPFKGNIQRACPDGMIFSRQRQRCVPFEPEQEPEFEPDDEPQLQLPNLNLKGVVKPQKKCNDGFAPDKNGRCVPIQ